MAADELLNAVTRLADAWVGLALVALAVLLLGVVAWLYRAGSALAELRKLLGETQQELVTLERRLGQFTVGDGAARLAALEQQLATLAKDQDQLMLRDAATGSYLQAIRHAQRGADLEELMRTHDLGRAEADLIMALYARAAADTPDRSEPQV